MFGLRALFSNSSQPTSAHYGSSPVCKNPRTGPPCVLGMGRNIQTQQGSFSKGRSGPFPDSDCSIPFRWHREGPSLEPSMMHGAQEALKKGYVGLAWWPKGKESALQCQEDPVCCTTTMEPALWNPSAIPLKLCTRQPRPNTRKNISIF